MYISSLESFEVAVEHHLISKNESSVKRVLKQINICLKELNKKLIEDASKIYNSLLEKLDEYNVCGRYSDEIVLLRKEYNIAIKRT